jgi:hypothetical protein
MIPRYSCAATRSEQGTDNPNRTKKADESAADEISGQTDDHFINDYAELYAEWLRHMQKVLDNSVSEVALILYMRPQRAIQARQGA